MMTAEQSLNRELCALRSLDQDELVNDNNVGGEEANKIGYLDGFYGDCEEIYGDCTSFYGKGKYCEGIYEFLTEAQKKVIEDTEAARWWKHYDGKRPKGEKK